MPDRLVLVRHCESQVDPYSQSSTWGLTAKGHGQAARLASVLGRYEIDLVACGDEPKMVQTIEPYATATGLSLTKSPTFGESHSEGWYGTAEFNAIVAAFFEEPSTPPAPGWEPSSDAATRFLSAIQSLTEHRGSDSVAVCSGGRVLTSLLSSLGLVASEAAFGTWQQINMPDIAVVDTGHGPPTLVTPFGHVGIAI